MQIYHLPWNEKKLSNSQIKCSVKSWVDCAFYSLSLPPGVPYLTKMDDIKPGKMALKKTIKKSNLHHWIWITPTPEVNIYRFAFTEIKFTLKSCHCHFQNQRNLGMPKPFQGVHPFLTQTLCPLNSYHQTADSTQQFLKEVFNFSSRYSNFIIFDCKIWQFHFWKGRGHCWSLNISNKPPLLWVYELLKVAKGFPIAIWKGCVQCSGLNKSANIF